MGKIADTIIAQGPDSAGMITAWYGFIAYTFQIYFDFSGYSDMAIGLGKMFGFHFLENFNYPYISKSITEFWRRWHISLSSFFRDYIYIPLGGNKVTTSRWIFNLIVVWSLTGLWHGANWNFIFWGLYYGIILIAEKIFLGNLIRKTPAVFQHVYACFVIVIGWVIFRIEDCRAIGDWLFTLFGFNGIGEIYHLNLLNVLQYYPWFLIALICSMPISQYLLKFKVDSVCRKLISDAYILILMVSSLTKLAAEGFNPFIYFRF